jgi:hypothetical protein
MPLSQRAARWHRKSGVHGPRPGNPQFPFPLIPGLAGKRGGNPRFPIRPGTGIGNLKSPVSRFGRKPQGKRGPDWPQIGKSGIALRCELNYNPIKLRLVSRVYQSKLSPRENHWTSLDSPMSATPLGGLWVRPCVAPCLAGGPSPDTSVPSFLSLPWAEVTCVHVLR